MTLPSEIGDLTKLNTLDMRDNPRLTAVPKEMCKVRTLETLLLDEQMMSFPSKGDRLSICICNFCVSNAVVILL